jgi:hypothetical protein
LKAVFFRHQKMINALFKAGDHFRHRVAAAGIGVFDRLQRAGHGMASEDV